MEKKREKMKKVKGGEGGAQLHSRAPSSSSAGWARQKAFVQRSLRTCSGGLEKTISISGGGLAASAAGTALPPLVGADSSARGRSSPSDGLEDSDDEEEEEEEEEEEVEEEEDDDEEEEDEEEAEEELEDVEELLLALFLGRLAGGFAAPTSSTPAAVKRCLLPSRSS